MSANGCDKTPKITARDLSAPKGKLEFTDLDYAQVSLLTNARTLQHIVGTVRKQEDRGPRLVCRGSLGFEERQMEGTPVV